MLPRKNVLDFNAVKCHSPGFRVFRTGHWPGFKVKAPKIYYNFFLRLSLAVSRKMVKTGLDPRLRIIYILLCVIVLRALPG